MFRFNDYTLEPTVTQSITISNNGNAEAFYMHRRVPSHFRTPHSWLGHYIVCLTFSGLSLFLRCSAFQHERLDAIELGQGVLTFSANGKHSGFRPFD